MLSLTQKASSTVSEHMRLGIKVVPTPAADRNARAAMLLPELLKNAVEVNRSSKYSGNGIDYGHVLLAVYAETDNAGNTEYNAVRIVVEHNSTIRSLL